MLTKDQWKQALDELSECPMFSGNYDSKNGNREFMLGISTVIEYMAYKAEDDTVVDAFFTNMCKSEDTK